MVNKRREDHMVPLLNEISNFHCVPEVGKDKKKGQEKGFDGNVSYARGKGSKALLVFLDEINFN